MPPRAMPTIGNCIHVHRDDKGLKAMTAVDDVKWLNKKEKVNFKRKTLFDADAKDRAR